MKFVTESELKVILRNFERKILSSLEPKVAEPEVAKPTVEKIPRRKFRGKK
jgi:hypothetical protein